MAQASPVDGIGRSAGMTHHSEASSLLSENRLLRRNHLIDLFVLGRVGKPYTFIPYTLSVGSS